MNSRILSVYPRRIKARTSAWACIVSLVAGCTVAPPKPVPQPTIPEAPPPVAPQVIAPMATPEVAPLVSRARNPIDYRLDVAKHLYVKNAKRIFSGKLPQQLYAVGVSETEIDPRGFVAKLRWVRSPDHAPEVVAEIERTIRDAAPYPVPSRLGRVTLTETWLWDKSGSFQLHTLTEGQL